MQHGASWRGHGENEIKRKSRVESEINESGIVNNGVAQRKQQSAMA